MCEVTPLAGVWVEIGWKRYMGAAISSLPLRECGLKLGFRKGMETKRTVTPLAGVWVEISSSWSRL